MGKPENLLVCEFSKESVNSEPVNLGGKLKGGQLGRERERQGNGVEPRGVGDEVEHGQATELEREGNLSGRDWQGEAEGGVADNM